MKVRDIVAILSVAGITMAFTLALLGPDRVNAVDGKPDVTPLILQPKLNAAGCVFTLMTDKATYAVGETPTLMIEATNPTEQPVETRLWLKIEASSPASMWSRIPVLPESVWSQECPMVLAAGETRIIKIDTKTALPAGKSVAIRMSDQDLKSAVSRLLATRPGSSAATPVAQADVAALTDKPVSQIAEQ